MDFIYPVFYYIKIDVGSVAIVGGIIKGEINMNRLYRIKWKHPDSKKASIGPVLIHMFNKKFYTLEEAEKICEKLNKNSNVVHTVHDSTPKVEPK